MDLQTALTFSLAFFVFAASPGPDNFTILSKTVSNGAAYGLAYGTGGVCSIFLFVVMAAVGFNAVAQHMNENLQFIQYIGAIYLIYTGITMWRSKPNVGPRIMRGGLGRLFLMGFVLNISNPKMPVFYLALLPGVLGFREITPIDTLEILTIIGIIETIVVGGHVMIGLRARHVLSDARKVAILNRGAGALMVGAGVLVATR
jgi:threonine/homoserine/homoserine lactone efflux protein